MKVQVFALVLAVFAATVEANPKRNIITTILKAIGTYYDGLSAPVGQKEGKPSFCGKYDCPSFTVKNRTKDYELRCYEKAYWVSTTASGIPVPMGGKSSKMFMRLFDYIRGENKKGEEIPMTVPVLNEVKGDETYKKLKMSFYVPEEFQSSPPMPKDPTVFLEKKDFCAYVKTFGGYPFFYSQYKAKIDDLKKVLLNEGLQGSYEKGIAMYSGYDEPWKLLGRRNEVMLLHV